MTDAVTVLVPSSLGVAALADLPGVVALRYGDGGRAPCGAASADALVVSWYAVEEAAALLPRLGRLRLVQSLTAGTEQWVGRVPASVPLANASGAGGGATAELAVAGLLAVLRELPRALHDQAAAHWKPRITRTLAGRRVLIVGAGDVGRSVAARVVPFGATATLMGRTARDGVLGIEGLTEAAAGHDVLVLAVPLSAATHRLVDAAVLAALPDGAVVVNVSRGPVLDQDELIAQLQAGRLSAVLDVTDPEPLPADHPLWAAPNLLLTPHLGGNTEGHLDRAWAVARDQIERLRDGRPLRNLVEHHGPPVDGGSAG